MPLRRGPGPLFALSQRMAQIGIAALLWRDADGYRSAGVSAYTERLVRGLAQHQTPHHITVYHPGDAPPPPDLAAVQLRATAWPVRRAPLRLLWEATALPRLARQLDLLHAPVNVLPPRLPCPGIVTIHDLAFVRFPEVVAPLRRRYLAHAIQASARRAAAISVPSLATQRDLIALWDIPAARIRVIPPAIAPTMRPLHDSAALAQFAARHHLTRPYILFLGTLEPRKNLATLLEAFALASDRGLRQHDLVLAGAQDWQGGAHVALLRDHIARRGLTARVHLPGHIAEAERVLWLNGATAVVLPSFYEGFGFPIAEALACGVPVIASDAGSLPEIASPHGILCDPADTDAWASALLSVADDLPLRARCRAAAAPYRARFTEHALALATLDLYSETIARS
jgi:glycosyltransferase involved in cell wall biosynthesis